jgi:hypothetical protein
LKVQNGVQRKSSGEREREGERERGMDLYGITNNTYGSRGGVDDFNTTKRVSESDMSTVTSSEHTSPQQVLSVGLKTHARTHAHTHTHTQRKTA